MQRMFNLDKWHLIPEGKALAFELDRPRVVRLDVNAAGGANLFVLGEKGAQTFLALVTGRDVIEFHVSGSFGLISDGDPCWIYTVDGDRWSYVDPDPEIFTRLHEARPRNHELEVMMAKVQQNMERRFALQADEIARAIERRAAARPLPPDDHGAGASSGSRSKPPKGSGGGGSDQKAGAPASDETGPPEPR